MKSRSVACLTIDYPVGSHLRCYITTALLFTRNIKHDDTMFNYGMKWLFSQFYDPCTKRHGGRWSSFAISVAPERNSWMSIIYVGPVFAHFCICCPTTPFSTPTFTDWSMLKSPGPLYHTWWRATRCLFSWESRGCDGTMISAALSAITGYLQTNIMLSTAARLKSWCPIGGRYQSGPLAPLRHRLTQTYRKTLWFALRSCIFCIFLLTARLKVQQQRTKSFKVLAVRWPASVSPSHACKWHIAMNIPCL